MSEGSPRRNPFHVSELLLDDEEPIDVENSVSGRTSVTFSEESTDDSSVRPHDLGAQPSTDRPRRGASVFEWDSPLEAPMSTSPEWLEGRHLGSVVIEARLGSGTHAHVYRARSLETGAPCAVKVPRERYRMDHNLRRRFQAEGRALLGLHHPNVVEHVAVGELEDGCPYLVLELVTGEPLSKLIARERSVSEARARFLCAQIAAGLGALHAAGLVHRDLKPGNIMVSGAPGDERLKILDLGLVRFLEPNEATRLTMGDGLLGTPAYMAPEQIRAPTTAGVGADLYALGVILFELLEGRRPFDGPREALLDAHLHRKPSLVAGSGALRDLAEALLEKDPTRRPQKASEVEDALRAAPGPVEILRASPWPWRASMASLFILALMAGLGYQAWREPLSVPADGTPARAPMERPNRPRVSDPIAPSAAEPPVMDLNAPAETDTPLRPTRRKAPAGNRALLPSESSVESTDPVPEERPSSPTADSDPRPSRADLERRGRRVLGLLQLLAERSPELVDELEARYLRLKRALEGDGADLSAIEKEFDELERTLRAELNSGL